MRVLSYEVTDGDRDLFNRNGYWISPVILDDATIEKLRAAHGRSWSKNYDGDGHPMHPFKLPTDPLAIRKLDNAWWINDDVREVVTDASLGKMAADLPGVDGIRLWHDQIIYKSGTNGQDTNAGNVGWHQDYGYWKASNNPNMVTVWIALQDTDISNGANKETIH